MSNHYLRSDACRLRLRARRERLEALAQFIGERFTDARYGQGRVELHAVEAAPGIMSVTPEVDDCVFYTGEASGIVFDDLAELLAAFCEPGSLLEAYDEYDATFHRLELAADGAVARSAAPATNPFAAPSCPVSIDNVVESVVWEDFEATLEIDGADFTPQERELAVWRAVKAYRAAIDACMADTRHDLLSEALESVRAERSRSGDRFR